MVGIACQVTDYMVERRLNLKDDLDQQDGDCVVKYRASASMESQCQVQLKRHQKEHRKAIEHAAVQAVHGNLTATCLCGSAPARRWIASTTWQRRRSWCSLLPDLSASPSMKHQVESDQGSGSEIASEGGGSFRCVLGYGCTVHHIPNPQDCLQNWEDTKRYAPSCLWKLLASEVWSMLRNQGCKGRNHTVQEVACSARSWE